MGLVCPLMIFLLFIPHNPIIRKKFLHLIKGAFKKIFNNEGMLYLACNNKKAFSPLQTIEGINFGLVRMPYRIFWIIFTSDLVTSYTEKLLVLRWVQIVLLL